MSTIPQFDPLSSEVVSPFLAGMSEGLNKISTALNLTNAAVTDAAMAEVYIGEDDRYRIYQVAAGNRLWLSDPAPVIKKNGSVITAGTADFTIDYVGGAIIFESASRLTVSDTVTASVTRIASASTEIVDIKANVTALQTLAGNFKGYYATKADLDTAYPTGANGNYAIIGGTVDSIYIGTQLLLHGLTSTKLLIFPHIIRKQKRTICFPQKKHPSFRMVPIPTTMLITTADEKLGKN